MANNKKAEAFAVGAEAWFSVGGEPEEGGGVYMAKVKAIEPAKHRLTLEMLEPVQADLAEINQYVHDEKIVISGNTVSNVPDGSQPGVKVRAALRDPSFPEQGYVDMVDLRNLNDAELAHNLSLRFHQDLSYCYCGNTCVAINIFYMNKEPRDHGWEDKPHKDGDPTKEVINAFGPETQKLYMGASMADNQPHVYAVADAAYQGLFRGNVQEAAKDQAVIITGESGAGKTYITGKVLGYLDAVNSQVKQERGDPVEAGKSLTKKIMDTMPIMDAFGNACMPRNNDSSRFGKLYKIYYDLRSETVKGAEVTPYLLEKSRVTAQASWERNFHLFYRFLAGSDAAMKSKFKLLAGPGEYHCLNRFLADGIKPGPNDLALEHNGEICMFEICDRSKYKSPGAFVATKPTKPGEDSEDVKEWRDFMQALDTYFPSDESKDQIFSIVSAVMLLSNVTFTDQTRETAVGPPETLAAIAELLRIDVAQLKEALTKVPLQGGKIMANMAAIKARKGRDSFASALYNDLFLQVVKEFSKQLMETATQRDRFLGVLDIFGFEFIEPKDLVKKAADGSFELTSDVNGFNQFNINLCNEKLQSHFVQCVFDSELDTYRKEGLNITEDDFSFERNDPTVRLLMEEGRDKSILALLDNETFKRFTENNPERITKAMEAKDVDFKKACDRTFAQTPNIYLKTMRSDRKPPPERYNYESFGIHHYAACVTYNVKDWWQANTSDLPKMVHSAVSGSEWTKASPNMLEEFVFARDVGETGSTARPTVGGQFRSQLKSLVDDTLYKCFCQFVRCIKPNKQKWSRATAHGGPENAWQSALVLNQLRYTGMLDTLVIRKEGYPARPLHTDFWKRYYVLYPNTRTADQLVAEIKSNGIDAHGAAEFDTKYLFLGTTRVLMKDETYQMLEVAAMEKKKESVLNIQSMLRAAPLVPTFNKIRNLAHAALPSSRSLIARAAVFREEETAVVAADRAQLDEYLMLAESMIQSEHEERLQMRAEERYTQQWNDATQAARFASDKQDAVDDARGAYNDFQAMKIAWTTEHHTASLTELLSPDCATENEGENDNDQSAEGTEIKLILANGPPGASLLRQSSKSGRLIVWQLKPLKTF